MNGADAEGMVPAGKPGVYFHPKANGIWKIEIGADLQWHAWRNDRYLGAYARMLAAKRAIAEDATGVAASMQ